MNSCIRDYSTSFIPSKFFHVPEELNIYFSFFDFFYFIFLSLILFQCFICSLYCFHYNRPLEYLAQMFLIATEQINFLLLLFWAFTYILKILVITTIPTKTWLAGVKCGLRKGEMKPTYHEGQCPSLQPPKSQIYTQTPCLFEINESFWERLIDILYIYKPRYLIETYLMQSQYSDLADN